MCKGMFRKVEKRTTVLNGYIIASDVLFSARKGVDGNFSRKQRALLRSLTLVNYLRGWKVERALGKVRSCSAFLSIRNLVFLLHLTHLTNPEG